MSIDNDRPRFRDPDHDSFSAHDGPPPEENGSSPASGEVASCAQADRVFHFWKDWDGPRTWRDSFVTVMKDCKSRGLSACVKVETETMKALAERAISKDRLDVDAEIICDPEAVREFRIEHS